MNSTNTPSVIALTLVGSIVGLVYLLAFMGKAEADIFKILVGGLMTVGFTAAPPAAEVAAPPAAEVAVDAALAERGIGHNP